MVVALTLIRAGVNLDDLRQESAIWRACGPIFGCSQTSVQSMFADREAARGGATRGMVEEDARVGARPLRIGWREMAADVAVAPARRRSRR